MYGTLRGKRWEGVSPLHVGNRAQNCPVVSCGNNTNNNNNNNNIIIIIIIKIIIIIIIMHLYFP